MLGISKEAVSALPEVTYPGRVILIDSAAKARDAVAYLMKQKQIGFDTETRPSFYKNRHYNVSLVQLSVEGECFLFRLKKTGGLGGLMSVLENPSIQKIGLSLRDDFQSLAKLCEFTPAGFVELQTFVKNYEIADNGLQKIFALIFGQRISKSQRLTNWEAADLTPEQQRYAAIDAWACVEIYNYLKEGKFNPDESPYKIDDETAVMLQNSVGIKLPLKNSEDDESAQEFNSMAMAEATSLNGKAVKRQRNSPAKATVKSTSRRSSTSKLKTSTSESAKSSKTSRTSKASKASKASKSKASVKETRTTVKSKATRKTASRKASTRKNSPRKAAPSISIAS